MEEYIIYILCFYCCEVIEKIAYECWLVGPPRVSSKNELFSICRRFSFLFFFFLSSESWQWMIFSVECEVDYSDYQEMKFFPSHCELALNRNKF